MVSGLKAKLDYEDFCSIPPDGKRYELLNGELHVTPSPGTLHQRTLLRLVRLLDDYFESPNEVFVSPYDVILSPHDIVEPDILVVSDPKLISGRGVEGAPFLVVEILSSSTSKYDRTVKAKFYELHGVMHYWIVDPIACRVDCYQLENQTYRLTAAAGKSEKLAHPAFPDFSFVGLWR